MICMYARLKDAQEAYKSVQLLQGKLSRENLMTVSPGGIAGAEGDIYSFDGNPRRYSWYGRNAHTES